MDGRMDLCNAPSFPLFASRFTSEEDYHFDCSFYSLCLSNTPSFLLFAQKKGAKKTAADFDADVSSLKHSSGQNRR